MTTYQIVTDDKKTKFATATNPLSAVKKAFPKKGWHWEDGFDRNEYCARAYLDGKKVGVFRLIDNG